MARHIEEFAGQLRELKERSGRSYGVLATRLHVSTSTLHRYCNGTAVPGEYAPVERFARQCGASAEELVALHRRWLLADAAKRSGPHRAPEAKPVPLPSAEGQSADLAPGGGPPGRIPPEHLPPGDAPSGDVPSLDRAPVEAPPTPTPRRRARRTVVALAAAAAVAAVLPLAPRSGHGADDTRATAPFSRPTAGAPGHPSPSASASGRAHAPATASAPATARPDAGGEPPVQVTVLADNWGTRCGQWFLLQRQPADVPSPPPLEEGNAWAAALGGLPAGHLRLELTAQGLPGAPVVLHALYVTVVGSTAAPKGNLYTPEDGCGGGIAPASFTVDLDAAAPRARAVSGSVDHGTKTATVDFPFRISASDPQVLDVDGHTLDHDVSWYMDLVWSCGARQGTLRIDDHGAPFRTTGTKDDPAYGWSSTRWYLTPPDAE